MRLAQTLAPSGESADVVALREARSGEALVCYQIAAGRLLAMYAPASSPELALLREACALSPPPEEATQHTTRMTPGPWKVARSGYDLPIPIIPTAAPALPVVAQLDLDPKPKRVRRRAGKPRKG